MQRVASYHARSASVSRLRKKTPPMPSTASATDPLPRPAHERREHVALRSEGLETRILTLRRVCLRNAEVRRRADLFCHRQRPFDQRLDPRTRGNDLAAREVDQLAREAVT